MTVKKLQALKNDLIRQGVSWKHATRYVRELEHHYDDLFVAAKSRGLNDKTAAYMAEQALGREEDLLREMANRPELQGIDQRYPKLFYLILPIVTFVAMIVMLVGLFILAMQLWYPSTADYIAPPDWAQTLVEYFILFLMYGLAPLLSLVFLLGGWRHQIDAKVLYTGVALVNLLGCAILIRLQWPDPENGIEGSLGGTIGYGLYGIRDVMATHYRFLLTVILLCLFGWTYRRLLKRH